MSVLFTSAFIVLYLLVRVKIFNEVEFMKDYALIATAYNNEIRIYASYTTNLVNDARKIHDTWPTWKIFNRLSNDGVNV